ncbi:MULTISPECIES: flagellar protein [unclassified Halanaerobium]|uniref:flagellar protein n=1 Tax=unclassified Halanaerobium TaxID=2641197 RepID=UPI000DF34F5B|nr:MULTISPECIES: flagellar protein [unclassified Halanaerobium]
MNLINCKKCGKVFASSGSKVCPACSEEEEKKFQLVKQFLWDNPNSTIDEVVEGTAVDRETIIKFMKEDRLASHGLTIDFKLHCRRCGKEIDSGEYCASCRNKVISDLNAEEEEEDVEKDYESGKMFLKDRIERRKK